MLCSDVSGQQRNEETPSHTRAQVKKEMSQAMFDYIAIIVIIIHHHIHHHHIVINN